MREVKTLYLFEGAQMSMLEIKRFVSRVEPQLDSQAFSGRS